MATSFDMRKLGILDQISVAAKKNNRTALAFGAILGGFVPLASYTICHMECAEHPEMWVLVIGGLVYSAFTVFMWAQVAFKSAVKAVGFVVLLEGILTRSQTHWLSLVALVMLMAINAIATACNLIADRKETRKRK